MNFEVVLDSRALDDIQRAIDFYDEQQPGLGRLFEETLNEYVQSISATPFLQVRYDNVRCLPILPYPYMIHFSIESNLNRVIIWGIFHTSRNPDLFRKRKK